MTRKLHFILTELNDLATEFPDKVKDLSDSFFA